VTVATWAARARRRERAQAAELARIVAPDHVSAPSDAIAALGPALGERS